MTGVTKARWARRLGAAAGLAGALALATGCGASPGAPVSGAAARPAAVTVVPWKPLDPTYPTIPRRTVPASPDPAPAEAAPPCRAGDLRATSRLGAGLGTDYLRITLRAAGRRPCRLDGHPAVTLLDGTRPVDVPTVPTTGDDRTFDYPDPVLVEPGTRAVLMLSWGSLWCTEPVPTDRVLVSLPGGHGRFTVRGFGGSPVCNGTMGDGPTPVRVATFAPPRSTPARVVSPYAGLELAARRTTAPHPGRPFGFTVALTARRDVVLEPCPDFTIEQYPGDQRSREDRYALNCAQVPTRDAEGQPYLPAGRPVTFAMRVPLADETDRLKFNWQLEVPGDGEGSVGLVVSAAE